MLRKQKCGRATKYRRDGLLQIGPWEAQFLEMMGRHSRERTTATLVLLHNAREDNKISMASVLHPRLRAILYSPGRDSQSSSVCYACGYPIPEISTSPALPCQDAANVPQ